MPGMKAMHSSSQVVRTFSVASPVFCFLRGTTGLLGSRGFRGFFSFGLSSAMGLPSGPTSFFLR